MNLAVSKDKFVNMNLNMKDNICIEPKLTQKNCSYDIVSITWEPCNENRFFPVWKYYTGKTMFWPCTELQ
jgi:hypothetical protein